MLVGLYIEMEILFMLIIMVLKIKNYISKLDINTEDLAAEVQRISEQEILNFIIPNLEKHGTDHLACGGGCFMNIKLNGLLRDHKKVKNFWVYPDAGDAGLSIGAAYDAYYKNLDQQKSKDILRLNHLYLGPSFNNEEIKKTLLDKGIKFKQYDNICEPTAKLLSRNLSIGWFQGKMETGPRALGNRSILMSPIDKSNKATLNAKIKYRKILGFLSFYSRRGSKKLDNQSKRGEIYGFFI